MADRAWSWDASLYRGAAEFYSRGRTPYPPELAEALTAALGLDGSGRLLDVGCGPGSVTLLLAPRFAEAVGLDPDADMLAEARRAADRAGVGHVTWRRLRAEQLPADVPAPTVVTFAQSFHWMQRDVVAGAVRRMLRPGGAVVHIGGDTHAGIESGERLPHPRPPRAEIGLLIRRFLGEERRAGRSVLPTGRTPDGEDAVYRAAGFTGPERIVLPSRVVVRTADEIRASVYSLSSSAPHLFADDLPRVDDHLRALIDRASPDGHFCERMGETTVGIWR